MRWNVLYLPLRSCSVDAVVSDLPFDMKCKMKKQDFPVLFKEIFRVMRVGARAVLLVRWKNLLLKVIEKSDFSIVVDKNIDVCVGGAIVTLFVLLKDK